MNQEYYNILAALSAQITREQTQFQEYRKAWVGMPPDHPDRDLYAAAMTGADERAKHRTNELGYIAHIALSEDAAKPPRPTVVCLCGSTRFSEAFQQANLQETLAGRIVLTIGCDMRSDADLFADKSAEALAAIKADLDTLHLRKIDMADEVLILNVGGYIGESTRRELAYAEAQGKTVRYLEAVDGK